MDIPHLESVKFVYFEMVYLWNQSTKASYYIDRWERSYITL